ncbi:DUF2384 domain-containing protein [Roseomonas sp. SSH11]|uniref:DUF2384 domain-containing protein n=1 Tax=Pararoseomonas baculiformis TaxID=2820812 RepID=A0ABS4AKS7_9PROT|nr:antitoxin Xre/MbcA/ParS toxin-binding domain-containing protein [Pararoseomonas baculiformis]MBP0447627.1 DUF2384 domain-containing protein [Pararoseomonas baculiformis]
MPSSTDHMDGSEPAALAELADVLDETVGYRKADAARAARVASALRGDAGPIRGEAARARLAHLALLMLAMPEIASPGPVWVARFLSRRSGSLGEAPVDLVRTVEGAEQVRRLIQLEPSLGRPDPERVAAAANLDDLTAEEAFAAYAAGHIASPRLMAITGLRSIYRIISALTQRDLRLPVRPSRVSPDRDDRDLLWEDMSGREDPALLAEDIRAHHRPLPQSGPELDAAWPTVTPSDPASQAALDSVTAALDAEVTKQLAEADRAATAAAGLRGDAAAVGGDEARVRLVAWSTLMMGRAEGEHRAFTTSLFLLQPLEDPDLPYSVQEDGDAALELARTAEGAAQVERWLDPRRSPPMVTVSGTILPPNPAAEEAFVAYAEGRIDSRRLMDVTGLDAFYDVWGHLKLRGLHLPVVPTPVAPGLNDRDLLWKSLAQQAED